MRNEKGFTLIELVMVIVILGILTAVAVPKFIDLRTEARDAALQGVVGAIASASAVNYAGRVAGKGDPDTAATAGKTCQVAAQAILEGGVPAGYSLVYTVADPNTALSTGANTCIVQQLGSDNTTVLDSESVVIIGVE